MQFGIAWVQNNPPVDFANGFIEVYRDARAAKGTSQSFVTITDQKLNELMIKLAANAQYFEDHAPWAPQYKKQGVQAAAGQGRRDRHRDRRFPRQHGRRQSAERKRDPREVRQQELPVHGQLADARRRDRLRARSRNSPPRPRRSRIAKKYGEEASDLMTALHEVIGHGSGKLNPKLQGGAEAHLKEYFSTLEEARADLMALWNIFDPKLQRAGPGLQPRRRQGDVLQRRARRRSRNCSAFRRATPSRRTTSATAS